MDDLMHPDRLQALFERATTRGLLAANECNRLRFFAAAEHAKRVGTTNPCGLFVSTVRNKRWEVITNRDEDVALLRIKRLDHGIRADTDRFDCLVAQAGAKP